MSTEASITPRTAHCAHLSDDDLIKVIAARDQRIAELEQRLDTALADLATAREECERLRQHNEFILSRWPDDTPAPVSVTTT